ncbi:hypothetical protein [Paenibacillus sp. AR247]|uniref:hypothetical protein n=1 Tax=Paenibacillus sp. AR247 TaxID=1631599 RepID=UPI000CF9FF42|nr:hypothetical protein [Paenibacillus sp. AR247]PQP88659.1 hypothetical protein CPT76_10215 [Paenibacillus sp. AR247]
MAGFEGAGYVTGYGTNADANTRFVVSVLDDGMYDVTIRYASGYGAIQIDHDRKPAAGLSVSNTNGQWEEATLRMFLRTGINLVERTPLSRVLRQEPSFR